MELMKNVCIGDFKTFIDGNYSFADFEPSEGNIDVPAAFERCLSVPHSHGFGKPLTLFMLRRYQHESISSRCFQ